MYEFTINTLDFYFCFKFYEVTEKIAIFRWTRTGEINLGRAKHRNSKHDNLLLGFSSLIDVICLHYSFFFFSFYYSSKCEPNSNMNPWHCWYLAPDSWPTDHRFRLLSWAVVCGTEPIDHHVKKILEDHLFFLEVLPDTYLRRYRYDNSNIELKISFIFLTTVDPNIKKTQEELDLQLTGKGKRRNQTWKTSSIFKPYILKETMSLYHPGPLSMPHEALEDRALVGYDILAGTRLPVNLSKLHRDPHVQRRCQLGGQQGPWPRQNFKTYPTVCEFQ